ncbi:MAG: hybrid sensor histidine kinase/response regulator [Deltaproteobacteria bacterium]|nr:MAG: hybrid sensor histidine kinase/response regulator [Deltaproteobacteria bacterium]
MASKAKIVVVDDSRTQRSTISLALEQKGYQVIQGSNGLDAISLVHSENPDLLVSDIMMPELKGYQVCRLLKNDPATEDLPVILLTTLDHQEHRFWGKEAGADSYVLKAADSTPLEKEVARLLKEKKRLPEEERRRKSGLPIGRQGAQGRLTDLLDRLLFEATIANRIREVGRFSGNLIRSLEGFFEFFQELIDYQIAILYVRTANQLRLILHPQGSVPAGLLETAKKMLWNEGFLTPTDTEAVEEHILNPECLSKEEPANGTNLAVLFSPFPMLPEEGGLAVFNSNPAHYTEETNHTLKIVARELESILKFNLQAEALEKLKADFTAMMIHDLRSPLTAILSAAALVGDGLVGPVSEEQKKWLVKMEAGTHNLLDLINDFLDLSKIEAGRIELVKEEMDLVPLIQSSLDNYLILAQDKKLSLRSSIAQGLLPIQADPRRLDQVFSNLLSNALKFTPEGGAIEVGASAENGTEVKVWVKDSGVGISAEEIGQIFEKYRQSSSGKTSDQKGTGLGLVICKMIVETHGGKIWVESQEGKGSTFFFTLPS